MCGNDLMALLVVVSSPVCSSSASSSSPHFTSGLNVTLKCAVTSRGGPKPEVYWRKIQRRRDGVGDDVTAWTPRRAGAASAAAAAAAAAAVVGGGGGGVNGEKGVNGGKDPRYGELWFSGNLSYSTFNFQVGCQFERIKTRKRERES